MTDSDDNPLARVIEALRAKLDARVDAARDAAARIREAADRYVDAVKAGVAADVAQRYGLDLTATTEAPDDAARNLQAIVESLPELERAAGLDKGQPPVAKPAEPLDAPPSDAAPASFGEMLAKSEPSHPRPERAAPREQADPAVQQLLNDLRCYDMAALSMPMFRVVAEELAARARELQDRRASDPDERLSHVFRVLTRCAYDRNATNVFGLNRQHQADWRQKAIDARERRLRLEAGEPDTLRQRLQIPKAIVDQVNDTDDPDEDNEDEDEPWALPRLASGASGGAVVLVGGVRKPQKIEKLRHHLSFDVEWIETSASSTGSIPSLERRVREGHVAAVVILEGLVGHKHYEPVIAAARQVSVPVAYGGRAGIGALKAAFSQIEAALS